MYFVVRERERDAIMWWSSFIQYIRSSRNGTEKDRTVCLFCLTRMHALDTRLIQILTVSRSSESDSHFLFKRQSCKIHQNMWQISQCLDQIDTEHMLLFWSVFLSLSLSRWMWVLKDFYRLMICTDTNCELFLHHCRSILELLNGVVVVVVLSFLHAICIVQLSHHSKCRFQFSVQF